ncbi:hypothetical protein ACFYWO_38195 [Streptomyces sp. NPDC002932]|uniref:hypothetical protein n=1 Tax=Streptomyces sp. NPDC002932 TaxID=3364672 RepID=UPI0036A3A68B
MDAQVILGKADAIEASRQAARKAAIAPLATILAERQQLQAALAQTEVPYGKAYAAAEAAGWESSELSELGAEEPTRRPRSPRKRARSGTSGPAQSDAQLPSQAPATAPTH